MRLANRVKPKHMELVIKIAETAQLQMAAQISGMSQPAASRILAEIEASLETKLFTRQPTGMELTAEGQVFVRHARVVLSEMQNIEDELARMRSGVMGHVRVGAVTGPALGCLMPAINAVQNDHLDFRLSVDVAPSRVLFRGLEEARYDFILGRVPEDHDRLDFHLYPGRNEVVTLLVHDSHPLAARDKVSFAELAEYPWVIQDEGNPIRQAVELAFHSAGVPTPRRVINSSSLLIALAQVAESQAISPQTNEVKALLTSSGIAARLTSLNVDTPINVQPYFIIRDNRRNLTQAADKLLKSVLANI
ncbi:HTH-type transcriptional regulator GbpR [Pelagimonas phthalicica]|uniref:HTH-type transcriptional regulator GbpR n=1 Tax=Pelagimonas phthalicica TaxID=1037362 RepID=A0A238JF31_9RHOB|nr:LysR family transcriptional regulator [Pelagimonas phthalicica]TDS92178.1 DNA-binding transcriptional LysR family regulator [Pelagimonas phthalicica]SMX29239.1 HTH-type transcriptional regulator GbpR [Pelagimonas phthalicica]